MLTADGFVAATGVSRETRQKLEIYLGLLERWQKRINLVGASTLADAWRRHMLDSAQLAPLIRPAARVLLDIGSGAGFPGLVLAVLRPAAEVHLVESDMRKAAFLREAAREMGAKPAIHAVRLENLQPFPCDTVTARAVAPVDKLVDMAFPFLAPGAECLFLKGAEAERELTESQGRWKMAVERIPSRSDARGVILRLAEISRGPGR